MVLVHWYTNGKIGSRERRRSQQRLCWQVLTQTTWGYFPHTIQIS